VQILLPKETGGGEPVSGQWFDAFLKELTDRFGGVTRFLRSPGEDIWQNGGEKERDSIAVIEVMADELDRTYWRSLRERLECELMQNEIVIRAQAIQLL
jgi:hypothetical protein